MNKKISEEDAINEIKSASTCKSDDVRFDNEGYQTKTGDAEKMVIPSVPEVRRYINSKMLLKIYILLHQAECIRSEDVASLKSDPAQITSAAADLRKPPLQTSAENINYHPEPQQRLQSGYFTFQKIFFSIRICLECLYRQDSLILGQWMLNL